MPRTDSLQSPSPRLLPRGTPVAWNESRKGWPGKGHLDGGGPTYARINTEDGKVMKVPWALLRSDPEGRARQGEPSPEEQIRATLGIGRTVRFEDRTGRIVSGTVTALNPRTASVRTSEGQWRVGYAMIRSGTRPDTREVRLNEVRALARELMDRHGANDWRIEFGQARKTLGTCNYHTRTIRLSTGHVLDAPIESVRITILHEIAHFIAGPKAGHGPQWKAVARRLGIPDTACASGPRPEARYTQADLAGKTEIQFRYSRYDGFKGRIVRRGAKSVTVEGPDGRRFRVPYHCVQGCA